MILKPPSKDLAESSRKNASLSRAHSRVGDGKAEAAGSKSARCEGLPLTWSTTHTKGILAQDSTPARHLLSVTQSKSYIPPCPMSPQLVCSTLFRVSRHHSYRKLPEQSLHVAPFTCNVGTMCSTRLALVARSSVRFVRSQALQLQPHRARGSSSNRQPDFHCHRRHLRPQT